jgi:hypothetical protein
LAASLTAYVLIAVRYEDRDLQKSFARRLKEFGTLTVATSAMGTRKPRSASRTPTILWARRLSMMTMDETGVTMKMVPALRAFSLRNRLVASVPHGHWKTLTLVAALRVDRMTAP